MKYYLRTDTQEQMDAALYEAQVMEVSPLDGTLWPRSGCEVLRIGTLSINTGEIVPAAEGASGPTAIFRTLPGYHVNLLSREPLTDVQVARLPIIPPPDNPIFNIA